MHSSGGGTTCQPAKQTFSLPNHLVSTRTAHAPENLHRQIDALVYDLYALTP